MKSIILTACFSLLSAQALADGSFVNWETPHVHPLDLTPDGTTLLAVNTADNRLEVFDATGDRLRYVGSVPVGIEPVSVRALGDAQAWVVNHLSDSVSIVDLAALNVVTTLPTLDEPADVVFAGGPLRAFVSCSQVNTILVYDVADLHTPPGIVEIDAEDPRALAVSPDGRNVYVAVFESGNGSTILCGSVRGNPQIPRNVVNDQDTPYGGQNPPPNDGDRFNPPMNPRNPAPPRVSLIVRKDADGRWLDDNIGDWTDFVTGPLSSRSNRPRGWDLPDRDVAIIDAGSLAVRYVHRLMNINMGLAVSPATGDILVVGTDATNEIRFEPNLQGRFLRVNLAVADPAIGAASVYDLNPHLSYDVPRIPPEQRQRAIGDPRGVAVSADGRRIYVTGMGSNNLVVMNPRGRRVLDPPLPLGEGPTGIVLDEGRDRAFVLNRFEATISTVSLSQLGEIGPRLPLFDTTPERIRVGRKHLYDTHRGSGLGHIACASCHVDARLDRLAWDLGDPSGDMKTFDQNCFNGTSNACQDWHPMKGPMITQTLQDIIGKEPLHYRGDRAGIEEFAGAFESLQGADAPLSEPEMAEFKAFLATIHLPPNPFRQLDNSLPTDLSLGGHYSNGRFAGRGGLREGDPLPNGDAVRGVDLLSNGRIVGGQFECITCHTFPTGLGSNYFSDGGPFFPLPPGPNGELRHALTPNSGSTNISMKIPQFRTLYERTGMEFTRRDNRSGFGYFNDGIVDSLVRFAGGAAFNVQSDQDIADIIALMLAWSGSDLPMGDPDDPMRLPGPLSQDSHAAVGRQVTVDADNRNTGEIRAWIDLMVGEADLGRVGVVVKGVQDGMARGYEYVGGNLFQSDRSDETIRVRDLRLSADTGAELTFTVVPFGLQRRVGIDRDEDGYFDRDERDACSDPADPSSTPENFRRADADRDGDVDLADFAAFAGCYSGAAPALDRRCLCLFDFNGDTRIDVADYVAFVNHFTGP